MKRADGVAIHSRGETRPNPDKNDGSRVVTPDCVNKGVALDGSVIYKWLTKDVAPRLEISVKKKWINF